MCTSFAVNVAIFKRSTEHNVQNIFIISLCAQRYCIAWNFDSRKVWQVWQIWWFLTNLPTEVLSANKFYPSWSAVQSSQSNSVFSALQNVFGHGTTNLKFFTTKVLCYCTVRYKILEGEIFGETVHTRNWWIIF